jgi:hypothetical protein
MTSCRTHLCASYLAIALAGAVAACAARAEESNFWPFEVTVTNPNGRAPSWSAAGPLFFSQSGPSGEQISGFRPFYLRRTDPAGFLAEADVLYPLFFYRSYGDSYQWNLFQLVNRYGRKDGAPPTPRTEGQSFDFWPFYFSRETGDPTTTFHALFPIAGSMQGHFGYDRISWTGFPLYAQTEKKGAVTTYTPWPFIRTTEGAEHGFALWPLFGNRERPGVSSRAYYLWPLIWNNTIQPNEDQPAGTPPTRQVGFLPFYASQRGPGMIDETFLWPFFGYTDRTVPDRYHETRYLWPLLVQGRGDHRSVERWAPLYTHSESKGVDKTWIAWPLWRRLRWSDPGIEQTKTQFFYFLYWEQEQRSTAHPGAAPARKVNVWPLASFWDNGAGRRQFEFPSLLEVFFPDNERVRQAWTPLLTLVRHDQRAPGDTRTSLLWDAVTWERHESEDRSEFHLGPLVSVESGPKEGRFAVGNGLFGLKRGPKGGGWRPFLLEFAEKPDHVSAKHAEPEK